MLSARSLRCVCAARRVGDYLLVAQRLMSPVRYSSAIRQFSSEKNFLIERGKAEENIFFLKKQREQLMKMRDKILKEKELISGALEKVQNELERLREEAREKGVTKADEKTKQNADQTVEAYNENTKA